MTIDDLELLSRWCAGDLGAGERLFERHFKSIYRFFSHKVTPGDVDDLVQDTFEACAKSRDAFRGRSSFRTYLFTIARNRLYHYWAKRAKRSAVSLSEVSLVALETSVGTRLAREGRLQWLLAALRQLPLEKQVLFELRYWQEFSDADLAEIFEIARPTVRSRLRRLRVELRELIGELEKAPPAQQLASTDAFDEWARSVRPSGG